MPQNGLHGLFGLASARGLARFAPADYRSGWVGGLVLGAMLPDIDMYPTGVAFLLGRKDLVYVIHRTATHSLVVVALAIVAALLWRWRRPGPGWMVLGLALGSAGHAVLDVFFWFTEIDLFWPLSHWPPDSPFLPMVDLWQGQRMEGLAYNIREACEFAAFALYLRMVQVAVRRFDETDRELAGMKKWEIALWVFFAIALATAFLFRETASRQNYVVTTPYLLAFLPYCWLKTWRNRDALSRWATGKLTLRSSG